jgi:hypothetical protein
MPVQISNLTFTRVNTLMDCVPSPNSSTYGSIFLRRRIHRSRVIGTTKNIQFYWNNSSVPLTLKALNQFQVGITIFTFLHSVVSFDNLRFRLHLFRSKRILLRSSLGRQLRGLQLDSIKILLCHLNLGLRRRTACASSTLPHLLPFTSGLIVMRWVSLKLTV